MANEYIMIELVEGAEGDSLCLCGKDGSGKRIAGPKPWGGGRTIEKWEVKTDALIEAIEQNSYNYT